MSSDSAIQQLPESPADAAARWFALRRHKPDCVEEQQFADWLKAEPAHRQAYDEVTKSWEIAAVAAADASVVQMRTGALMFRPEREQRDYSRLWGALATALLVLIAFTGAWQMYPGLLGSAGDVAANRDRIVFRTSVGQRAKATLEDGSTVVLNTNSVLEVSYTRTRRDLRLVSGQALFEVAKDAARPFVVAARDRQIVAVGTEFEVLLDGNDVRVALLEGKVRVQPLTSGSETRDGKGRKDEAATVLHPGEQLLVRKTGAVAIKPADVERLISWTTGRVRFDNTPLSEAVTEMNRYSGTPIVIADPAIADMRISGAFRTGQSRSFAEAISEAFPVEAEVKPESIRLRRAS